MIALLVATALAAPTTQWVWSTRDLAVLTAARESAPDVGAALEIGEISFVRNQLHTRIGMAPHAAKDRRALVIRIDDSVSLDRDEGPLVDAVRRLVELTHDSSTPVQIDYDCPVRLLPRWAQIVAALRRMLGAERELWLTSIPAHMRDARYGGLFRDTITGHVLQLFDTGELPNDTSVADLASALQRANIPYGLGVAVFERAHGSDHVGWRGVARGLATDERFRGWFVFTAGERWTGVVQ